MINVNLVTRRTAALLARSRYFQLSNSTRFFPQQRWTSVLSQTRSFTQSSLLAQAETGSSAAAYTEPRIRGVTERDGLPRTDLRELSTEPTNVVYVGNLFFEATEEALQERFEEYGKIRGVTVHRDRNGISKGYGFVDYENIEDAKRAVKEMYGQILMGRRAAVNFLVARQKKDNIRPPMPPSRTLFIGNISFSMTDKDLSNLFRPIRNVVDVRVAIDRRSGQPRGYAHADFIDIPSAAQAKKELETLEFYDRPLRVDYSTTPASSTLRQFSMRKDFLKAAHATGGEGSGTVEEAGKESTQTTTEDLAGSPEAKDEIKESAQAETGSNTVTPS